MSGNIIKLARRTIMNSHKKNHTDQIPFLLNIARVLNGNKKKDYKYLLKLLHALQDLLWCIDDTVDNTFLLWDNHQEYIYLNEITKFTLFLDFSSLLLDYQFEKKEDFLKIFLGQKIMVSNLLNIMRKNLRNLVSIPHKEREEYIKIKKSRERTELNKHTLMCCIYRSKNLELYMEIIEKVLGIIMPKKEIILIRAAQLIKEDFEDLSADKQTGSVNIIVGLERALGDKNKVVEIISDVIKKIEKDINKTSDPSIKNILLKKFSVEKKQIMYYIKKYLKNKS